VRKRLAAKSVALGVATIGMLVAVLATARLMAVVIGSPVGGLALEIQREVNPSAPVDAANQARAATLSRWVSDAALVRTLLPPCLSPASSAKTVATGATCLSLIDAALRRAPASGELWLFKGLLLAGDGDFGSEMMDALRNSYKTSPSEGWLASGRVATAIRLYAVLPDDLKDRVVGDLRLVLTSPALASPLIRTYLTDARFRAAARPVLEALPPPLLERFVGLARSGDVSQKG
jgi:hypothetical protein